VKKLLELTLGIVTSIGGFLEAGSLATAAQAGAEFRYQLVWAIALGTVSLIFLVEMSGRLAAVSKHTIVDAMRERFGFNFFVAMLLAVALVSFLVLASEIGGVCLALQLATGIGFQWWALPVALTVWLVLWKGSFGVVEKGAALLGLVTVAFIVGALKLHPHWTELGANLLPTLPKEEKTHYWFIAVSILGASISPYLFYFYSSGAIEDKWDESYLPTNKVIATLGMTFGGLLSVAVLVVAALVFHPRGIQIDRYEQLGVMLSDPLGRWGFYLFVASLGIACFGAALEISLAVAYMFAQGFGWNWSKNQRPKEEARFSLVYTLVVALAAVPMLIGLDPLRLTIFSMALTAVALPIAIVPFLFLMNDEQYVREHRNGLLTNTVVTIVIGLSFLIAIVAIPLQIFGS
jgi:Mn2+/Fe2+ NRAMP family transporter